MALRLAFGTSLVEPQEISDLADAIVAIGVVGPGSGSRGARLSAGVSAAFWPLPNEDMRNLP